MIIVYTGNGKGKTSAALGTVLRTSGYAEKSCIIQFIKDGSQYGEHYAVQHYLNDLVDMFQAGKGFYKIAGDKFEETDHKRAAAEAMELARRILRSKEYDLIVLDEILTAGMVKLIDEKEIIDLIHAVPDTVHCILYRPGSRAEYYKNCGPGNGYAGNKAPVPAEKARTRRDRLLI
ncbi:MAG: cob(I)yrinic acid a,c-diamide adenosyltransferase [Candidatus Marinimicrobia bacterium]|nr:cob(I)yrinic acid a,c-diamide adenosyltransferase [Candidatus Neomarinimicrobiota bacterium]